MSYLHGIEIKEGKAPVILSAGDTSVVGIVGTAPKGKENALHLITSKKQAVEVFGEDVGGFTLPSALDTILSEASVKVIAVNVLPTAEITKLMNGAVMKKNADKSDWITTLGKGTLASAVDFTARIVSGLGLLKNAESEFGIKPNLILANGYSQLVPVANAMKNEAERLNGIAVVDMLQGTVTETLTARANTHTISSPYVVYCYPEVNRYNAHESENQRIGLSVMWVLAKTLTDAKDGYWVSPSNTKLNAVLSTTQTITASLTDPTADTNMLNAQGITTIFRKAGTGFRLWGNWTSGFPASKLTTQMVAPHAVRMVVRDTLEDSALKFLDKTVNKVTVDLVLEAVNSFLRNLIGSGALIAGDCSFLQDKNPNEEIAQGKLKFNLSLTFAPSLDKLEFEEGIDISKLTF